MNNNITYLAIPAKPLDAKLCRDDCPSLDLTADEWGKWWAKCVLNWQLRVVQSPNIVQIFRCKKCIEAESAMRVLLAKAKEESQ